MAIKNLICDNSWVIEAPITAEKVEIIKNSILQNPIFQDKGISLPPVTDVMITQIAAGGSQCQTAIEGLIKDVQGTSLKEDFNDLISTGKLIEDVAEATDNIKLEKLKITIRTFLPYNYVNDPLNGEFIMTNPPYDSQLYKYNQDILDLANVRDYPQYRNIALHGSYKTQQVFELDFKNKKWIHSDGEPYYYVPPTSILNNITQEKRSIVNDESNQDGTSLIGLSENKGIQIFKFQAKITAGNPAFDPSPNIDYDLIFEVAEDGNYRVDGFWDGFPAIEIFMENQKTGKVDLLYYKGTVDARQTPKPKDITNLFPILGDIDIHLLDNFGNKPQKDKQPYADVKIMENLFGIKFKN